MQQSVVTIRVGVVVTVTLWLLTAASLVAAWVAWMLGESQTLVILLSTTSGVLGIPAGVSHVHLFVCRLAVIVRTTSTVNYPPTTPLDTLRLVND